MLSWIRFPQPDFKKFVFLDRDGVINVDSPHYIKHRREFRFYPDALEAMRWLRENEIEPIIISNQSALGRGLLNWDEFWEIHELMVSRIREEGGSILAAFYCPHRPEEGCSCRKPLPGMILAASQLFGIRLSETFMIGDKITDEQAGENSGCRSARISRILSGIEERSSALPACTPEGHFITLRDALAAVYGG